MRTPLAAFDVSEVASKVRVVAIRVAVRAAEATRGLENLDMAGIVKTSRDAVNPNSSGASGQSGQRAILPHCWLRKLRKVGAGRAMIEMISIGPW